MALENQPSFQAPSIPKPGSRISSSSSIFSNVANTGKSKFSFKKSNFKFSRSKKYNSNGIEEKLKPQIQSSIDTRNIAATLVETNRILVDIQKQLALDFANRIAEKKQLLEIGRRSTLKQKAVKKEAFVERGRGDSGKLGALGSQILAPTKGIFDKIIEFLSLLTTGIVINSAWKWLSKKENRDKLIKIFQFLREYWKQILAAFIAYKIIKTISKLVGFANTLRKIFRRLRDLKGKGKFQKPPKPGSPEFCNPVVDCVKNAVTQGALSVALSAALLGHKPFIEGLKGKIGSTTTVPAPIPPEPVPQPDLQPVLNAILELTKWAGTVWNLLRALDSQRAEEIGPPPKLPSDILKASTTTTTQEAKPPVKPPVKPSPVTKTAAGYEYKPIFGEGGSIFNHPMLDPNYYATEFNLLNPKSSLSQYGPTLTGAGLGTPLMGSVMNAGARFNLLQRMPFLSRIPGFAPRTAMRPQSVMRPQSPLSAAPKVTEAKLLQQIKTLLKKERGIEVKANSLEELADALGVTVDQLVKGFTRRGTSSIDDLLFRKPGTSADDIMDIVASAKKSVVKKSRGGTIFGSGAQSVDSVPAMLAPGEEVIRASAANQFRPLLKDINDNAGRMWMALTNSINVQERNNRKQNQINNKFTELITKFDDHVQKLTQEKRAKQIKEAQSKGGGKGGGSRQSVKMPQSSVKTKLKTSPKQIQTYNIRKTSSNSGQPAFVNMPMPPVNLAPNQKPEAPNTNVHTPSSAGITITPFDASNPYISESYSDYGIFV